MEQIKDSQIQKNIDDCKCPEKMWCTVTTTCYEKHKRERLCLKCWLRYCEENNIEVIYG